MDRESLRQTELIEALEHTLRYLYDPVELRNSALRELLSLGELSPMELQNMLIEAIESLRPGSDVPLQANAWRYYHLLYQRYVEQYPQALVAQNMALSERQLRRLHPRALEVLAIHLAQQYPLRKERGVEASQNAEVRPSREWARRQELERIQQTYQPHSVKVHMLLEGLVEVITPLADARGLSVRYQLNEDLPEVLVEPTTLRSALLSILSTMVPVARASELVINVSAQQYGVQLAFDLAIDEQRFEGGDEAFRMAQELVELSGASLHIGSSAGDSAQREVVAWLPAVNCVPVLALDDNPDVLQLYERYLSHTRYRLIPITQPDQLVPRALEERPEAIILDLMLPGTDGWEILGRIRATPILERVPIIVVSILPQEDLALALGAVCLIRKPVRRAELLRALEQSLASSL